MGRGGKGWGEREEEEGGIHLQVWGEGTGKRLEETARTDVDKTCHISKQDRVETHAKASVRTASDEEPAPPNGPQRPHPEARSKQEAWRLPQPSTRSPAPARSNSEAVGGLAPLGGGAGQAPRNNALSCGPWLLALPRQ